MATKHKVAPPSRREEEPLRVIDTFKPIGLSQARELAQPEPSCFNSEVRVRRYRITVELIEEPDAVIQERILALWQASRNHHDVDPLQRAARTYDLTLPDRR